jgi:6,7-dimethyl-8-ribityllumazine synthase
MPHELHGQLGVDGQRFAIVVSRVNDFITSKLLAGAIDALKRHECADENITCVHVPGRPSCHSWPSTRSLCIS